VRRNARKNFRGFESASSDRWVVFEGVLKSSGEKTPRWGLQFIEMGGVSPSHRVRFFLAPAGAQLLGDS